MTEPIRIANCSGFYGDRLSAAREMVEGGPIDVLTGDWLAELTMLILARSQAKRAGGGYARSFVTQMEQVMGTCLDRGIKVVSNAGGLDPAGCAEAVAEVAAKLGLAPTVAYVEGDNLMGRLDELTAAGVDLAHFETGEPAGDTSRFISANAYLGCWGIVDALDRGADIVITGRTTDAAIVCGPAAWHHRWERDDWDQLAGAVVAGHVIECGTQATGGNYAFFTEVPGMVRTGFPWAEIAADGSSVIGKHPGTGGEVSVGTVTSQLLYEIASPAYLGPDVTARFDTIELSAAGPDRVRISGTRGEPPPPTLKVAMNELGGYRYDIAVALTGLDIEAKAALVEEAFWSACPHQPEEFATVATTLVRTDKEDPATNEEAVALWRLTLKDPDERKVGRTLTGKITELALASYPGFFVGPTTTQAYGVYWPAVIPADLVHQEVVLDGDRQVVDPVLPPNPPVVAEVAPIEGTAGAGAVAAGLTRRAPFGLVVGARSGDKGGNANLGVWTRTDAAYEWLAGELTVERLRRLLPECDDLPVVRFELPNLRALNFVVMGLLGDGVASSTRIDGQAKSLGEYLRAKVVDIPIALLEGADA
jgi:hypothetical protein